MFKAFRKFIQFSKVEEQKDGTLFVYGLVTAEKPDQEDEVCDYVSTKPLYQKLVARYAKATEAVDGMDKSIAPLREMHKLEAVGCGKSIDFDDEAKTIHMGFHVVATETCKKVRAGVLIGFSQGGDYEKTWKKGTYTWYTADPGEVSLVDSPCLEDALIERLAEKTFMYVQENGSSELRKFKVEKKTHDDPANKDLLEKIADLTKQIEELKMKPELQKILAKLAKAGTETVTLSKEEMLELAELSKGHAAILDHLKDMHKAATDHMHEMHEHIAKCHKSIGAEPMKADKTGDVKKDFSQADIDAAVAKALEKKDEKKETPDVAKLVADAVEKAMKEKDATRSDPTNKAKLMLIGRDGKEIEKRASDLPEDFEAVEKSVGF